MRRHGLLLWGVIQGAALTGCHSAMQTVPAITPTQSAPLPEDLRNWRYCEVIPVFQKGLQLNVEVYNTLGLNECPAEAWAKLSAEALAKQYGAKLVKLNGPRYWVLNKLVGAGDTASGQVADFGGIQMKRVGMLQTKVWQGTVGDKLYTPNEVHRTTVYTYRAGNLVYELTSPSGEVYRMQSYAQIADPKLSIDDLENLGSRLKLPAGWSYRARRLDADTELKTDGLAYVINDDFYNSYQRVMK
ncbi:MAG: hypothetical protein U1A78_39725 [Polyangia bacterium]